MGDHQHAIDALRAAGILLGPGLTAAELADAESRYGFRFPPDLAELLRAALPQGRPFPDWRAGDEAVLRDWLDLPARGVLFDVERNAFWLPEWGDRPPGVTAAKAAAARLVADAPKLIPIYSHRMMPDEPHERGNPVFSVHQTDIICYGRNLAEYLHNEFEVEEVGTLPQDCRSIRFWNIDRFQAVRWGPDGTAVLDNRRGVLP